MNNVAAPTTVVKRTYWKIYQDEFTALADAPALLLLDELRYRCRAGRWKIDYQCLCKRFRCSERWLRKLSRRLEKRGLIDCSSVRLGRGHGSTSWVDTKVENRTERSFRSNSTLERNDRSGVLDRQSVNTDRQTTGGEARVSALRSSSRNAPSVVSLRETLSKGDPDLCLARSLRFKVKEHHLEFVTGWSDQDREHAHRMLDAGLNAYDAEFSRVYELRQRLTDKYGVDPEQTFVTLKMVVLQLFQGVRRDDEIGIIEDQRELLKSWCKNSWGVSLKQLVELRFGQRVFDRAVRQVVKREEVPQEA